MKCITVSQSYSTVASSIYIYFVACITGEDGVSSTEMKETDAKEKYWEVPINSLTVLTANGEAAQRAGSMYEVRCNVLKQLSLKYIIIIMDVSCHRPFLPGNSLEPRVIPTTQASSFTLQYFPYYVWCSKYSCFCSESIVLYYYYYYY